MLKESLGMREKEMVKCEALRETARVEGSALE